MLNFKGFKNHMTEIKFTLPFSFLKFYITRFLQLFCMLKKREFAYIIIDKKFTYFLLCDRVYAAKRTLNNN